MRNVVPLPLKVGQAVVVVNHRGQLEYDTALSVVRITQTLVVTSLGLRWRRDGTPYEAQRRGLLASHIRVPTAADAAEMKRRRLAADLGRVDWASWPIDALEKAQAVVDAANEQARVAAEQPS